MQRRTDLASGTHQRDRLRAEADAPLVRRCLDGDDDAWRSLVRRYARLVYSIPRRYGLSDADCEDVFQGVFAALVDRLPRLRDHERLAKWLITTAHRIAWKTGRGNGAENGAGVPVDGKASDPPVELSQRWERQDLVREALTQLGGQCERLLRALYLERERPSYAEVAARLDLPVGSIGPTQARCLTKLMPIVRRLGVHRDE